MRKSSVKRLLTAPISDRVRAGLAPAGLVLLLGWLVVAGAACGLSPEAKKQKALGRGEEYLTQGKVNEGIIELQNALKIDPAFVPALHALGRAYMAKAWFADAARELARAQQRAPDSVAISADFGRALVEVGAWVEAEAQAARILGREPQNSTALYVRAAALLGQGKAAEVEALLAGVPKGSMSADLGRIHGEVLMRRGRLDEAAQALRDAQAADPKNPRPLLGLGTLAVQRRDYAEAGKLFEQAKALRPQDPGARLGLADVHVRTGKVDVAIKELEGIDPRARSAAVQMALGRMYLAVNRPAEAIRALAPVVERRPKFAEARGLLGAAYLAERKADLAIAQFEELARQVPDRPNFQFALGTAYLQGGRPADALARLDAAARAYGKVPDYHVQRASALLAMGRLDEAAKAAATARDLEPKAPQPYLVLGEIRAVQGQAAAAREMYAKAAEVDATYAPAHLAMGQLHAVGRDMDSALKEFDAAVKADPRSLVAIRTKAAALVQQKRAGEAIAFVASAAAADPGNAALHALLGGLHAGESQWDRAQASYRKALELDAKSLDAHLGLARLAMREGKDAEAIRQLQAAVKARPDHPAAVMMLASLHARLAQYDMAITVLEPVVKSRPGSPAVEVLLADMYRKTGRYDDAIDRTGNLLKKAPTLHAARLIRADAALAKGDAAGAIRDLVEITRANPKAAVAHYYLGRAHASLRQVPEAQAAYREALRLDPKLEVARADLAAVAGARPEAADQRRELDRLQEALKRDPRDVEARERLAVALLRAGQQKEAEAELKQVLERVPGRPEANVLMARLLLARGQADDAASHLRAVLKTNPSHVPANLALARYLLQKSRAEDAITHVRAALRVNPGLGNLYAALSGVPGLSGLARDLASREAKSPGAHALVGWTQLLVEHNAERAVEGFRAAIALKPDSVEAHRGLAQANQTLNRLDAAVESYQRVLALNRDDLVSLNNLAWILSEVKKKPDQALPLATRAVELSPRSDGEAAGTVAANTLDTLGWIHYRRGAYPEAEKALARAAERAPLNAGVHYHLGMTYARLGRKPEALASLRKAAELSPELARTESIADRIKEVGG